MMDTARPSACNPFSLLTTGVFLAFVAAALAAGLLSPLSYVFAEDGMALVERHFSEPSSVYPAKTVALFFAAVAVLSGLAALYARALRCVLMDAQERPGVSLAQAKGMKAMAWLMLSMHIMMSPIGNLALQVETAFKGQTSEVTLPYELIAFLALLTAFALAGFRQAELAIDPALGGAA